MPEEVSPDIAKLIKVMLSLDPKQRPTIDQVRKILENLKGLLKKTQMQATETTFKDAEKQLGRKETKLMGETPMLEEAEPESK